MLYAIQQSLMIFVPRNMNRKILSFRVFLIQSNIHVKNTLYNSCSIPPKIHTSYLYDIFFSKFTFIHLYNFIRAFNF